jgi:cyanophycin synthetase
VGERGGFLERLREGTWAGHILEHVVLELQNLAGMKTGFGKTRSTGQRGVYKMAFRTRQPEVGFAALEAGHALLMAAINDTPFDLPAAVTRLKDLCDRHCLGPSTNHIVEAATERSIPHIRLNEGNLVQLGQGAAQRRIWTAETDRTSAIAESIASDKDLTKSLLASCGVTVPEGTLVKNADEAWAEAQDIGLPVVLKPYDGNHGRGVSLNLSTEADIRLAYDIARAEGDSSSVLVERFIPGDEHRLLVVGREMVAAAKGESLWVTGDGQSTVRQLVDSQINTDPRRGETEDAPLNLVKPDESAEIQLDLKRQGLSPQSVPAAGQKVLIQINGNVSNDVTARVHASFAHAAALAARVVGLDIAGIDLVAEDITRPMHEQQAAIIEVNASPGLLMHIKPAEGTPQPVGTAIMRHLFPEQEDGRIPIVGITGSRGGSLIARLIGCMAHLTGKHTGIATGNGLYLDQRQVTQENAISFEAGQRLLINRNVEVAVFESDARLILTEGLPYDRCLVGVVTDLDGLDKVRDLHIQDEDQLAATVRTQVDVVLARGTAVLNGAIAAVAELAELCDGEVILYGTDPALPALAAHRSEGKRSVVLRGETIVLDEGNGRETALLSLAALKPGTASPPENVLAAVAAAWALGIGADLICAGIQSFDVRARRSH